MESKTTFLLDSTTGNVLKLLQAYTSTSNPLLAANTTECGIETHENTIP